MLNDNVTGSAAVTTTKPLWRLHNLLSAQLTKKNQTLCEGFDLFGMKALCLYHCNEWCVWKKQCSTDDFMGHSHSHLWIINRIIIHVKIENKMLYSLLPNRKGSVPLASVHLSLRNWIPSEVELPVESPIGHIWAGHVLECLITDDINDWTDHSPPRMTNKNNPFTFSPVLQWKIGHFDKNCIYFLTYQIIGLYKW